MDNLSILIVEDQAIVAMDMQMTLRTMGYQVAGIARSGAEALAQIEATRPDVVLMDIQLDGQLDGIETTNLIRSRYASMPVIYVTANTDAETMERARQTHPTGYLNKPFTEAALKQVIRNAAVQ